MNHVFLKKIRIPAINSKGSMTRILFFFNLPSYFHELKSFSTFLIKYVRPFSELVENPQETGMHFIATLPFSVKVMRKIMNFTFL